MGRVCNNMNFISEKYKHYFSTTTFVKTRESVCFPVGYQQYIGVVYNHYYDTLDKFIGRDGLLSYAYSFQRHMVKMTHGDKPKVKVLFLPISPPPWVIEYSLEIINNEWYISTQHHWQSPKVDSDQCH